ncbi:peptide/nickel transport system permease protein [Kitasatospora sp. MAP12-15]|uniref:ABC transporter permease n=1 Tax=unclassified Kitasatospora TaxID=2633591 RepID=UPI002475202E|nr:ABC transporter permease [Kitasatospora sp. MAP12-44]MDH6112631.1 peptide/nickel transport system permease protein [Kitasatospora sp. MAP12-44]
MLRFLIRRALGAAVIMVLLIALTYFAFFSLPVDPAQLSCSKGCSPQLLAQIRENMHLNQPIIEQFWHYFSGLFVGQDFGAIGHCAAPCFGYSYNSQQFVWDRISANYPATFVLAIGGAACFLTIGVGLGMISAWKQGSFIDKAASSISLIGQSTQIYFIGPLAMALFVWNLHWLPQPAYVPFTQDPWGCFVGMILPWTVMSVIFWSNYTRQVRSLMLEQLSEDHIRAARAKGMANSYVWWRYALRGAMAPIITIFGLDLGAVFSGAIITEYTFGVHGLGYLAVQAVNQADLYLELGVLIFSSLAILFFNIIVDAAYALLDPRVRLG